jgi:hypothetical protein
MVIYPWYAARLVRQHRLDGSPFVIGEFIAHDLNSPVRGFESQPLANLNPPCVCHSGLSSVFGAKRT